MTTVGELPSDEQAVLEVLSGSPMLWLTEVANWSKRTINPPRQPMYDRFPGIRRSGVYVIRDIEGPPELYYVGVVDKDPLDGKETNVRADGIIGRLSTHRNMDGSPVLQRWWDFTNPNDPLPAPLSNESRDRVRAVATRRVSVTFCACRPDIVRTIERGIIDHGLPPDRVRPILNSPHWSTR